MQIISFVEYEGILSIQGVKRDSINSISASQDTLNESGQPITAGEDHKFINIDMSVALPLSEIDYYDFQLVKRKRVGPSELRPSAAVAGVTLLSILYFFSNCKALFIINKQRNTYGRYQ